MASQARRKGRITDMTKGRHSTIRRSEVRGAFSREDNTAGVPLTGGMAYALLILVDNEMRKRAVGAGELPVTSVGTTDGALYQLSRLMKAAIAETNILRDIPHR